MSNIEVKLGKINYAYIGYCGYQESMIGLSLGFNMGSCGIGETRGDWAPSQIKVSDGTKWTEADRSANFAEVMRYIDKCLSDAKVTKVQDLVGIPVEVTIEDMKLKSWRILTEVL